MENKKALIITYFEAPNYGAFLQAFATQEFLKSRNIDAFILPHKANKPSLVTKYFDRRVPREKLAYRDLIQKEIDKVRPRLNLAKKKTKYDVAVIGSDEIWNVIRGEGRTVVDGMEQIVKAGDVITMAAGCKHTVIEPYVCFSAQVVQHLT